MASHDDSSVVLQTPAKNMRSEGQEVGALVASATGQTERDAGFINVELRKADAGLAAYIAGLLRDNVLQKALKQSMSFLPTELGKRLPSKARKIKSMPPAVKLEFLLRECPAVKSGYDERIGQKGFDGIPEEKCDSAIEYGLGTSITAPLSKNLHGHSWSNPLLAVWSTRHSERGSPLRSVTWDNIMDGTIGYFSWQAAEGTKVTCSFGELTLNLTTEQLNGMPDLKLVNNSNAGASLVAESVGYSQNLHLLLKNQLSKTMDILLDKPFEHPEATKQFKDLAPPVLAATAKAKSKATAKAKQTPKVARRAAKKCSAPES